MIGYAIWNAVHAWARNINLIDALDALQAQETNAVRRLGTKPQLPLSAEMLDRVQQAQRQWEADGRPGLAVAAAKAESFASIKRRRDRAH